MSIQNELNRKLLDKILDASEVNAKSIEDVQKVASAVEELCRQGANPCALHKMPRMSVESTALIMACAQDLPWILRLILKSPHAQSNPSAVDEDGDTALHAAVERGSLECFQELLPLSNVDIRNNRGRTPLMIAVADQEMEMVEALARSSDLAVMDDEGRTALARAEELSKQHPGLGWQNMAGILRAVEESRQLEPACSPSRKKGRVKSL